MPLPFSSLSTPGYTGSAPGVGPSGGLGQGGLQRLIIRHETSTAGVYNGEIRTLFNPSQISTGTAVKWSEQPHVGDEGKAATLVPPTSPDPSTLTTELFFDTALRDGGDDLLGAASADLVALASAASGLPLGRPSGTSVLPLTASVYALTRTATELHRPPVCRLWWGGGFLIQGVLTQLNQVFSRFLPDGTPIRATLSCTFTEYAEPTSSTGLGELHSPDVERRHRVAVGESLSRLAARYYGDPRKWRLIARANGITNPRAVQVGDLLDIPVLR